MASADMYSPTRPLTARQKAALTSVLIESYDDAGARLGITGRGVKALVDVARMKLNAQGYTNATRRQAACVALRVGILSVDDVMSAVEGGREDAN